MNPMESLGWLIIFATALKAAWHTAEFIEGFITGFIDSD